jgi:hypothetical protein
MSLQATLPAALAECRLHAEVLTEALSDLSPAAFTAEDVTRLGSDQRRVLDQLAYRFGKLQDSMGEKVLPAVLDLVQEPLPPGATFAEKLQRLERIGAIANAADWRRLRELRNQMAHEYPDQPHIKAAVLNRFVQGVGELLAVWGRVQEFTQARPPTNP